jgi:hypothetical protein
MLRLRHVIAMIVVGAGLGGCFPPPLSKPAEVTPAVTSMYDGTYRGSVQLTAVASMAHPIWCKTDDQVTVQISNGLLSYAQPRPGYPDSPVVTYTATVTTDSKINGSSSENGTITGQIVITHLSATVDGLGCSYTLDANRS